MSSDRYGESHLIDRYGESHLIDGYGESHLDVKEVCLGAYLGPAVGLVEDFNSVTLILDRDVAETVPADLFQMSRRTETTGPLMIMTCLSIQSNNCVCVRVRACVRACVRGCVRLFVLQSLR